MGLEGGEETMNIAQVGVAGQMKVERIGGEKNPDWPESELRIALRWQLADRMLVSRLRQAFQNS
jgi:hypothetical protein